MQPTAVSCRIEIKIMENHCLVLTEHTKKLSRTSDLPPPCLKSRSVSVAHMHHATQIPPLQLSTLEFCHLILNTHKQRWEKPRTVHRAGPHNVLAGRVKHEMGFIPQRVRRGRDERTEVIRCPEPPPQCHLLCIIPQLENSQEMCVCEIWETWGLN